MGLSIDHIVISVNDVNAAIETYRGLGFHAFYGGKHANGLTHNGLVVFKDGSYLELIGLIEPGNTSEGDFYELVRRDGSEGYTGFALLTEDIAAEIDRIRRHGISASDIQAGSRTRTDGAIIRWKISSVDDGRNPFIITDETPRLLRVPAEGDAIAHDNGASGIADVRILVAHLGEAVERYTTIIGSAPVMQGGDALFAVSSGTLTLAAPATPDEQAHLQRYGVVPYQITLVGAGDPIPPEQAHGARLVFAG